jgi:Rrf2 family protein
MILLQFSIGVEYALHCLLYMVDIPPGKSVGIKDLATYQGVSETYLSKVYTKLRKSCIVKSIPGVNGGYALARNPEDITFWDIIEAVEGSSPLFQCVEIRQNELLLDKDNLPDTYTKCPCLVKAVMWEAEEQMRQYLRNKTLAWLHEQVRNKIPEEHSKATIEWFNNTKSR